MSAAYRLIFLILIVSGWPSASVLAAMSLPGAFVVSDSGAATYSIPIQIPPGVGGTAPKLSFEYSSQSGNGLLGVGWSLGGLGVITRCPRTMAQDGVRGAVKYDWNDRYCLDGQRLIAISGIDGQDGTEYRTELSSFSKIVSYGTAGNGPAYFKVWTKSGLILEYGGAEDSRIMPVASPGTAAPWPSGTIRVWAQNRVIDISGNYYLVAYAKDLASGEFFPERIDYAIAVGNDSVAKASIRIILEDRSDGRIQYLHASLIQLTKRLKEMSVYVGSNLVASYSVAYDNGGRVFGLAGGARAIRFQRCFSVKCQAAVIEYRENQSEMLNTAQYAPPVTLEVVHNDANLNHGNGVEFLDLNGDGRSDMVQSIYATGTNYSGAWLNSGAGWSSAPQYTPPENLEVMHGNINLNHHNGVRILDLNGDRLPDMVRSIYATGTNYSGAWLNTGNGWIGSPQYVPPVALEVVHGNVSLNHHNGVQLLDLNGDGLPDMIQSIYATGTTYSGAWLNTGNGWVSAPQYAPPVTLEVMHGNTDLNHRNGVQLLDLNGDGLPDIVQSIYATGTTYSGAWLNTGSGWVGAPQYIPPVTLEVMHGNANLNHRNGVQFVDLNGDGLPDMVQRIYAMGASYSGAWLNTGNGWVVTSQYVPPVALEVMHGDANLNHKNGVQFVDLNGDGLSDIVQHIYAMGTNYSGAWLSTGGGWVSAPQYVPSVTLEVMHGNANQNHHDGARFIDLNGDGRLDLVQNIYAVGSNYSGAWVNKGSNPDLPAVIENAVGAKIGVDFSALSDAATYTKGSSAAYPITDLQPPMYVVSSVTTDNSAGSTLTTTYKYGGLKAEQGTGRGSLGFAWIESRDVQTGLTTRREFRQDYPYVGLISKLTQRLASGGNGGLIKQSETTYACIDPDSGSGASCTVAPGKRYFIYASAAAEQNWDLDGTAMPSVSTARTYDCSVPPYSCYGNAVQVQVSNSDGSGSITTSTYYDDPSNWILGRLIRSTVTQATP